ncbi:unnamed protein product, partial [Rotaria sordida]
MKDKYAFLFFNHLYYKINLASTATVLNANQLAQQYTTARACSLPSATNPTTTLLQTTNTTQSPLSLSTLQQHSHQH